MCAGLLPRTSKEFSLKNYWDEFFSKRGTKSFDWYGEYTELCGHLHKYIKPTDKILVAGCGNSTISADLYKCGLKQITNVDISEIVIRQMKEKYLPSCSKMEWVQGDLFDLQYEADSFSCCLDKGTLDALMSENIESDITKAKNYFQEVGRILKFGGRYICISLLQEHILSALLDWFPKNGWFIRFCRCEEAEKSSLESGSICLPVFVIVCTKFKATSNFSPIIELNFEDQITRVTPSEIRESVVSLQQFAVVRHNLQKKFVSEEMVLELWNPKTNEIRYKLFIVDSPKFSNELPFAVFIVPHGRETEWIFKTNKGQLQLSESARANRLVVVHLMRNESYGTMKDVQDELSSKVVQLSPAKLPRNYKIPFLSVGSDLGERKEVFRGKSQFSGEYVVEEVKDESSNTYLRRLIFLNNQNLVQSEAKLYNKVTNKKKSNVKSKLTIDPSYLACAHHYVMLSSFELASYSSSVLLIGLGGGALATYIHRYFPRVTLTAVDIDEEIAKVARNWFNFVTDSRLICEIEDGVQFIRQSAAKGDKYGVIMFDVDSKEVSEGISCPPKEFVERGFLDQVANCLDENGLFVLNLVCRDKLLKEKVIEDLKSAFSSVVCVSIPEEVNVILFCYHSVLTVLSDDEFKKKVRDLNNYLKKQTNKKEDVLDIEEIGSNFKVL